MRARRAVRPRAGRRSPVLLVLLTVALTACDREQWRPDLPPPHTMELPAPTFQRPDPAQLQQTLANGLVAYVVEDHTTPLVTVAGIVGAGSADGRVAGASEAWAAALRAGGTEVRSRLEVARLLDDMVAELSVTQTPEETRVVLNVPAEDWEAALGLLADLLQRPAVQATDVTRISARGTRGIDASAAAGGESGPVLYEGSLASAVDVFTATLLDGHPYGTRAITPSRLGVADAVAFQQSWVVPSNVALAVGGDLDGAAARAAVEREFSGWRGPAPAERAAVPEVSGDASRRLLLLDADKLQGWLVLGHELPVVPLEDEAPLQVMNYILGGGHFDTRLFRATRDLRGLTNDDSGFPVQSIRGPGTYTFRTYGRPEVIPLLLHLTLEEIERIRSGPVSEEELFVAQGALADGEYTLAYRDGHVTALSFAEEWIRYGSHERSASYPERVRAVTAEAVRAAAAAYLHPERMDAVLIGPVDAILAAPPLEGEPRLDAFGTLVRR